MTTENAVRETTNEHGVLTQCPRAAADARELARRLGQHRKPGQQAAVVLMGSKANGTHRTDSDTDLMVVTVRQVEDVSDFEAVVRTAARFQTGHRAPYSQDRQGTDLTIAEGDWDTMDFTTTHLETNPASCHSEASEIIRTHNDHVPSKAPDLTRVEIRRMSYQFPSERLTEQNAVIFADTGETMDLALSWIRAVPTAPRPEDPLDGWGVHILPSEVMVTTPQNGYGRMDFWDRPAVQNDRIPPPLKEGSGEQRPPHWPEELAEEAVRELEEAAETAVRARDNTLLGKLEPALQAAIERSNALHEPEPEPEPELDMLLL